LSCDLIIATLSDATGARGLQAFHIPYPHLHATPDPACALTAQARRGEPAGEYELTVRSDAFARSVHVDVPGYVAPMQYFHLAPGAECTMTLRARPGSAQPLLGSVDALNSRAVRIEVVS
jgi:hypothetical protein